MNSISLAVIPLILVLGMGAVSPIFAQTSSTTSGTLNILSNCGVESLTGISFGSVTINQESKATSPLIITGTGSVSSVLTVNAKNWIDTNVGDNEPIIRGEMTHFSVTIDEPYADKLPLNSTDFGEDQTIGAISRGATLTTHWEVLPILEVTSFSGDLTQVITIWSTCDETP